MLQMSLRAATIGIECDPKRLLCLFSCTRHFVQKKCLVNEKTHSPRFERHGLSDMYTETAVKAVSDHIAPLILWTQHFVFDSKSPKAPIVDKVSHGLVHQNAVYCKSVQIPLFDSPDHVQLFGGRHVFIHLKNCHVNLRALIGRSGSHAEKVKKLRCEPESVSRAV